MRRYLLIRNSVFPLPGLHIRFYYPVPFLFIAGFRRTVFAISHFFIRADHDLLPVIANFSGRNKWNKIIRVEVSAMFRRNQPGFAAYLPDVAIFRLAEPFFVIIIVNGVEYFK